MKEIQIKKIIERLISIEPFALNHDKSYVFAKAINDERTKLVQRLEKLLEEEGMDYFSFITFKLTEAEKKNIHLLAEVSEYFFKREQHQRHTH